jgi:hypothetical protein
MVGVSLILDNRIAREALRNGLAISRVCGEIGGDGYWQMESHDRSSSEMPESVAPSHSETPLESDRDKSVPGFSVQMQCPAHVGAVEHAP